MEVRLKQIKKSAFTLAEVLIVIGVIGIIADMTIPTLKSEVDKIIYVTQLKKFYSVFQQGLQMIMLNEGVRYLKDSELMDIGNNGDENFEKFKTVIEGGFKVVNSCRSSDNCPDQKIIVKYLSGSLFGSNGFFISDRVSFKLADGMIIYPTFERTQCNPGIDNCGFVYVNLDGAKKPNIIGRDIFIFHVSNNGTLYSRHSYYWAKIVEGDHWETNKSVCGEKGKPVLPADNADGVGCAARIIESGWKMDY